jgi:hypothetical protein
LADEAIGPRQGDDHHAIASVEFDRDGGDVLRGGQLVEDRLHDFGELAAHHGLAHQGRHPAPVP